MAVSPKLNASFINNRNNGFAGAKAASTAFEVGDFVTFDGSGGIVPVSNAGGYTDKILGLSNQQITSASANYATTDDISISTPVNILDELLIPVSSGTAILSLVGSYVDVAPASPGTVDVSAPGTQILVTRIVDAATIKGVIALTVA